MAGVLRISNARLRGREGAWDITVEGGKIAKFSRHSARYGAPAFDAAGCLVTESFVIAHLHLDKVRTAERASAEALARYQEGRMDTRRSIALASEVKKGYSRNEIIARARRAVEESLEYGVTHMRAFADTDTKSRLEAVKALMVLREEFKGRVEIQVVAFPQEGIEADPGAEEYVERAIELGADVVGGIPWLERSEDRQRRHIDKMFAIAKRHDRHLAMLVDDAGDAKLKTLEMLASKTIKEKWFGKVEACHARAMQLYSDRYARRVAGLCATAGIGVVSSPHTGPLHTSIDVLRRAGVTVALGQDDCSDAYYPYGRCDMLEVAFLASHLLRKMGPEETEELYDMITVGPAKIIGVGGFGLKVGNPANLVVLGQRTVREAFAYHERPRLVVSHGNAVGRQPYD
ncbi:MAG: amidohydrolase family protein [Nitrososphaerales archaeon]|nr:amidohydrolase family protein [Nitrososphaerales archaeon]